MAKRKAPAKAGPVGVPKKKGNARTAANTKRLKEQFCAELRKIGVMRYACQQVNVGKSTVARWRAADPAFEAAVLEALDDAVEGMEQEAFRRAVIGTEKPVTVAGQREVIREHSDTLLIFLLKANRPEKYRDRYDVRHTGANGGPIQTEDVTDDELRVARMSEMLQRVQARKDAGK